MQSWRCKRLSLGTFIICAFAALGWAMSNQQSQPMEAGGQGAITVEIASPEHFRRRVIAVDQPFPVVVTNASQQPLGIWRDWCSWGYQQLSFEVTDDAGRKWTITRKDHPFNKNYPDFWTLDAREPLVLSVTLNSDWWESVNGPPVAELKGKAVTIRAVFAADQDEHSLQNKVWAGRVESSSRRYEIE